MGEVYLALDTELDRTVAIKILPAALASDQQRLQRFIQEAKAVSALNHPHILTIHEIGTTGTARFIATEFIDGETLRQRISAGLKLGEILEISIQAGSALAAAHAAGIVHRDIKPENIMIRSDGIVKVLDFGLAKLTAHTSATVDTEALTRFKTDPGTVVGTVIYMSPEQARGLDVDTRTDIWSLGVVLYEMVAGCWPFSGATSSEVMASILSDKEPQPLARYSREVPAELERIVSKALRKNRDERYQTIKDMLLDLQSLKQELEFEKKLERSVPPEEFRVPPPGGSSAEAKILPPEGGTLNTRPASSVEYVVSSIKQHKHGAIVVLSVLLLAAIGIGYWFFIHRSSNATTINSIAVLPFVNASADPETEYLSDGITESLINSLSQLPNLKMIARSSVFLYKGKEVNPQAVGRELGVQAILTGRVVQHGDNLSISAELVDVQNNSHLWGEQYHRKLADLLTIQSEISLEISQKLRLRLAGEDQKRVTKHYTENTEAYQLYLKGRYYWNKFSEGDFKRALDFFQQAIDKDPNYTLAYAGMADCYWQLGWYSYMPKKEAWPKARAALERALERDKTVAEVHTSLATYKDVVDRDYEGAEVEFKLALSLNGSDAQTHMQYSWHLAAIGQVDRAIEEAKKGHELDPLSLSVTSSLGQALFFGRRYDEAIEFYQQGLRSDPNFAEYHAYLGSAFEQKRMYDDAINEFEKARDSLGEKVGIGGLGHAYAVSGKTSEAQKLLNQLLREAPVGTQAVALIYIGLGDKDSAFMWLNKTFDDEESRNQLVFIKVDPIFDDLRADQRFTELLRRMSLTN
jgi:serine/threonine-protein kinase